MPAPKQDISIEDLDFARSSALEHLNETVAIDDKPHDEDIHTKFNEITIQGRT